MIKRSLQDILEKYLFSGKTIFLAGPRQVGKTTLLQQISFPDAAKILWLNGDNPDDRAVLENLNGSRAKQLFPKGSVVVIDEAQRLENAGIVLKIIHDNCTGIQLIATGSSAFELTDKIKEPLTGRKFTFRLYPVSLQEFAEHTSVLELFRMLETRMVFGGYPEVINHPLHEKEILTELINDYLYKDIFALKDVRKPMMLEKLVQALAFQVSQQVSYRELANIIGADKETVERYIYMLEEAYIIFRLGSFSRNLRNELKFSRKIYFNDVGIRNAVIRQFSPVGLRNDVGALWENLMISERKKALEYQRSYRNCYFWRTTFQQEIDYIEEFDGKLLAFEFKWNPVKKSPPPARFLKAYPNARYKVITRDNFYDFVCGKD